ncbi:MAG: fused isobutyryl-CoA mutase/GTPase IcmF [Desulfatibacillaceae bacterium]
MSQPDVYRPKHHVRIVTATSLFDGHDASINIMRRILHASGAEVIHLGHNRSVLEIVDAAIEEDVQGIALSSYQGGHVEFFKYMVDLLRERDCEHIRVFGGGGGVIVPHEIRELESYGVSKIYSPEDGAAMGLQGIINDMMERMDFDPLEGKALDPEKLSPEDPALVARLVTMMEDMDARPDIQAIRDAVKQKASAGGIPTVGFTGTGGAGKSSLVDELVQRFLRDFPDKRIAVVCSDPSRRKTGGALLGDRLRMNAIDSDRCYMRSLATRATRGELSEAITEAIDVFKAAGYDLILAETAGIGQGDTAIVDCVDVSLYVMTGEFGAGTQLEKIDMLDFADLVVVNKFEKSGGRDAVRLVRKQIQRNRNAWDRDPEELPVYGTTASAFNDDGVTALYHALLDTVAERTGARFDSSIERTDIKVSTAKTVIIPPERVRYLSEISETVRAYHRKTEDEAHKVRRVWHFKEASRALAEARDAGDDQAAVLERLRTEARKAEQHLDIETRDTLDQWPECRAAYEQDEFVYKVRGKEVRVPLYRESMCRKKIPKVALPRYEDPGELYKWLRYENLPGSFPFTAGVFPFKRVGEDPTRMFAGEGDPARTNRRFRLLSSAYEAKRLSTAFDSVTLYGQDPGDRPDIYGKIGTSGVSVCTLEDVKTLYSGFDLCAPTTSVSMTINGPAPAMLAMFFNTAIDQQVDRFREDTGREPDADEYGKIRAYALSSVRGTVQADILKEDQGQNTCIFSTEFALKIMGDIQQYFIDNNVRNFYSVSVSGYHIAEAGANPITQLAFTLANGFTYLEYYLSRGMDVNAFAPNFSYFFSNGMDPEYTVIGRVARRIWAVALREKYNANVRSQMLKYHIQTSGRSLHSMDIQFNDIRTTLQALCAIYDNCNSLHTNAYDEAITTPTTESVRRALAIQLIIGREWGLAKNENPNQGAFIVRELTDLVEEAVLSEFDRITTRGGVLGAMEMGYQRGRIQDESIYYETLKHSGELPVIGVNTFIDEEARTLNAFPEVELSRATEEEKSGQVKRLHAFQETNADKAGQALKRLQQVALDRENIFAELMNTVRYCSLGQISDALFEVGGQYRRNM